VRIIGLIVRLAFALPPHNLRTSGRPHDTEWVNIHDNPSSDEAQSAIKRANLFIFHCSLTIPHLCQKSRGINSVRRGWKLKHHGPRSLLQSVASRRAMCIIRSASKTYFSCRSSAQRALSPPRKVIKVDGRFLVCKSRRRVLSASVSRHKNGGDTLCEHSKRSSNRKVTKRAERR
jgi:hypothetical protein